MIRKILKLLVPRALLKKAFLTYNQLRLITIDKILFPEESIAHDEFLLYRRGNAFIDNKVVLNSLDVQVKRLMSYWLKWYQEEYILNFTGGCVIEPNGGWAVSKRNRLIYYSLGLAREPFVRKPDMFRLFFNRNVVEIADPVISLRDTGEENFFHFFNDVITKVCLLRSHGVDVNRMPLVISSKLMSKAYAVYHFKHNPVLQGMKLLVQDSQYLKCENVFFCKAMTHRPDFYRLVFSQFRIPSTMELRTYVKRNKSRGRYISNEKEVETILIEYNFKIVDCDSLSVGEQIALFSNSKYIVAIHGAGLTNLAFRMNRGYVLEIFPYPSTQYLPFHYIMLAQMFDLQYDSILGERSDLHNGFELDANELRLKLKGWFPEAKA